MLQILVFIFIIFTPLLPAEDFKQLFIVWNVGQGQWTTQVDRETCLHFDVGGEFKPAAKKLKLYCDGKQNALFFSHWDWDHIGLVKYLDLQLPKVCIMQMPGGEGSESKQRLLKSITPCAKRNFSLQTLLAQDAKSNNANSNIFVHNRILIPGDSPTSQEKLWLHQLKQPLKIQTLILGHHGSRTSTSRELLSALPQLRLAITSARKKRYGHPHLQTLFRLQQQGIPVLRTEDWGHIVVPISVSKR